MQRVAGHEYRKREEARDRGKIVACRPGGGDSQEFRNSAERGAIFGHSVALATCLVTCSERARVSLHVANAHVSRVAQLVSMHSLAHETALARPLRAGGKGL